MKFKEKDLVWAKSKKIDDFLKLKKILKNQNKKLKWHYGKILKKNDSETYKVHFMGFEKCKFDQAIHEKDLKERIQRQKINYNSNEAKKGFECVQQLSGHEQNDTEEAQSLSGESEDIRTLQIILDTFPAQGKLNPQQEEARNQLASNLYNEYLKLLFDNSMSKIKIKFVKFNLIKGWKGIAGFLKCKHENHEYEQMYKPDEMIPDEIHMDDEIVRTSYRLRKTLLHEMCHQKHYSDKPTSSEDHGTEWEKIVKDAIKKINEKKDECDLNVTSIKKCHKFCKSKTNKTSNMTQKFGFHCSNRNCNNREKLYKKPSKCPKCKDELRLVRIIEEKEEQIKDPVDANYYLFFKVNISEELKHSGEYETIVSTVQAKWGSLDENAKRNYCERLFHEAKERWDEHIT